MIKLDSENGQKRNAIRCFVISPIALIVDIGGVLLLPGAAVDDDLCDFSWEGNQSRCYSDAETDILLVSLTLHSNEDTEHTLYIAETLHVTNWMFFFT